MWNCQNCFKLSLIARMSGERNIWLISNTVRANIHSPRLPVAEKKINTTSFG